MPSPRDEALFFFADSHRPPPAETGAEAWTPLEALETAAAASPPVEEALRAWTSASEVDYNEQWAQWRYDEKLAK